MTPLKAAFVETVVSVIFCIIALIVSFLILGLIVGLVAATMYSFFNLVYILAILILLNFLYYYNKFKDRGY